MCVAWLQDQLAAHLNGRKVSADEIEFIAVDALGTDIRVRRQGANMVSNKVSGLLHGRIVEHG